MQQSTNYTGKVSHIFVPITPLNVKLFFTRPVLSQSVTYLEGADRPWPLEQTFKNNLEVPHLRLNKASLMLDTQLFSVKIPQSKIDIKCFRRANCSIDVFQYSFYSDQSNQIKKSCCQISTYKTNKDKFTIKQNKNTYQLGAARFINYSHIHPLKSVYRLNSVKLA